MNNIKIFLAAGFLFFAIHTQASEIYKTGSSFEGIRDFREVMPGVLYRGGANGRHPISDNQLKSLCEKGMGQSVYLYKTEFSGPSATTCSQGDLQYVYKSWQGKGRNEILKMIYNTIKNDGKPVFVHCWYGIHATGFVAAAALMQFCDVSNSAAIEYWKVGIATSLQYPKVIEELRNFKPDPAMTLTSEEQARVCPQM